MSEPRTLTPEERDEIKRKEQQLLDTSPIYDKAIRQYGSNYAAAVVAAYSMNETITALTQHITRLESIAPRKITIGGQTFIWRCPDHLI